MRCVFCHEDVRARQGVACKGEDCGALYHKGCWEEWSTAREAKCAVPGCPETEVAQLSRAGGLTRVLGLLVTPAAKPERPLAEERLPGCCSGLLFFPGGHIAMLVGMSPAIGLYFLGAFDSLAESNSALLQALVGVPLLFLCMILTVVTGWGGYRLAQRVVRVGRGIQALLAAPPDLGEVPPAKEER